jgi:hypothetical protein
MKVLVCGSRDWVDRAPIERELRKLSSGTIIIHGGARGADTIAGEVAKELGFVVRCYPADWDKYGRGAGPRRNALMLIKEHRLPDDLIHKVLAFSKDFENSRGTKDMMQKSTAKSIPVEAFSV